MIFFIVKGMGNKRGHKNHSVKEFPILTPFCRIVNFPLFVYFFR